MKELDDKKKSGKKRSRHGKDGDDGGDDQEMASVEVRRKIKKRK